jgi:hypothetical protein
VANVLSKAILPHSLHSLSATRSLDRVAESMMNREALGLMGADVSSSSPSPSPAPFGVLDRASDMRRVAS